MDYSINSRPLLAESDSEDENIDLRTQTYQETVIVPDNKPLFRPPEPRDKYNLAYLIFYLLGITTLLPWNFFITADSYWMYKFRKIPSNFSYSLHDKRTTLQAEFTSYLSVASSVPNILFLMINTLVMNRLSLHFRVIGSLTLMLFLFITTTVLSKVNTDDWQVIFFIITLSTVVLLNVASAMLSGSIFGIIGKFSPTYITAAVGGQALGGIFAAVAQIISLAVGISATFSAFVYFMVGNSMILLSIIAYIILTKSVFFKYHISEKTGLHTNDFQNELLRPRIVSYKAIFRKIWGYGYNAFAVFMTTLMVYPGLTVLVESEYKHSGSTWSNTFFVPTVSYLLFSVGDYIGRLLAGYIQRPKRCSYQTICNILRLGLIPLFFFCNFQPRHLNIPIWLDRDYYYIILICIFSLTNGYMANLAVMMAPRCVEQHEKETASSMITVFIGLGLGVGSTLSLLLVKLL